MYFDRTTTRFGNPAIKTFGNSGDFDNLLQFSA